MSTSEILMQSFFSDYQKDDESIVKYGSRIEDTLVKAIGTGNMKVDHTAKDAMLRSKFWTGIRRTRQIIRYRATATLQRPQNKQYSASK